MTTRLAPSTAGVRSVLVVLPTAPRTAGAPSGDTVVLGVPLRRRIAVTAERAGFGQPWAGAELNGTGPARTRIALMPDTVIPQAAWLREWREMPLAPDTLYLDTSGAAIVETDEPARVLKIVARGGDAREVAAELRGAFPVVEHPANPAGRFAIGAGGDVAAAETWLLRSLIKDSEGFMSRHFERRISLALTRRLVRTAVTPNMITMVSVGIGLLGAPFFLSAEPWMQVTGALLFLAHSILDGCDGEIARLKFLESREGAILDFWGDNLVHQAIFACMAVGWSLASQATWPLVLGLLAVAATLGTAAIASRRFIDGAGRAGADRALARLVEAFSHRDFIYLILALAAFGRAQWFIALAAAGTPVFLLLFAWVGRTPRTR